MTHFQINNFNAKTTRTGLEDGQLPASDNLYTYFSVKTQTNDLEFSQNWEFHFETGTKLNLLQEIAKNNWKGRDRVACIKEFILNTENKTFN